MRANYTMTAAFAVWCPVTPRVPISTAARSIPAQIALVTVRSDTGQPPSLRPAGSTWLHLPRPSTGAARCSANHVQYSVQSVKAVRDQRRPGGPRAIRADANARPRNRRLLLRSDHHRARCAVRRTTGRQAIVTLPTARYAERRSARPHCHPQQPAAGLLPGEGEGRGLIVSGPELRLSRDETVNLTAVSPVDLRLAARCAVGRGCPAVAVRARRGRVMGRFAVACDGAAVGMTGHARERADEPGGPAGYGGRAIAACGRAGSGPVAKRGSASTPGAQAQLAGQRARSAPSVPVARLLLPYGSTTAPGTGRRKTIRWSAPIPAATPASCGTRSGRPSPPVSTGSSSAGRTRRLNDRRLRLLMTIAEQEHFKLAMIYEGLDFDRHPLPPPQVAKRLQHFPRPFASDPVFFRLGGKPLTIWSGTWAFSHADVASVITSRPWQPARPGDREERGRVSAGCRRHRRRRLLLVVGQPGHQHRLRRQARRDEPRPSTATASTGSRRSPRASTPAWSAGTTVVPRHDGQTLRTEYATALRSSPDVLGPDQLERVQRELLRRAVRPLRRPVPRRPAAAPRYRRARADRPGPARATLALPGRRPGHRRTWPNLLRLRVPASLLLLRGRRLSLCRGGRRPSAESMRHAGTANRTSDY